MSLNTSTHNVTSLLRPEWFIPKTTGATCRPQAQILGMFAVYNVISAVVSYIVALPFFFSQAQLLQKRLKRLYRRHMLRSNQVHTQAISETEDTEDRYSSVSVLYTTLGSVAITMSAPLLAGLGIYFSQHRTVNFWHLVQQYSTRPRGTFLIFLVQSRSAWRQASADYRGTARTSSMLLSASTAVFADTFVSMFGFELLIKQYRITGFSSKGSESDTLRIFTTGIWLQYIFVICDLVMLCFVVLALLWHRGMRGHVIRTLDGMFLFMGTASLVCCGPLFTFAGAWLLWSGLLTTISSDQYCLESSLALDVVYCCLPVVLGVWRLFCATRVWK